MNSKLIKDGKILYEFEFPIQEIHEIDNRHIVILRIPTHEGKILNENVFCVDKAGKLVWQIEKRPLLRDSSPYIGSQYDGKTLILHNLYSYSMTVDIDSGKVTAVEYVK